MKIPHRESVFRQADQGHTIHDAAHRLPSGDKIKPILEKRNVFLELFAANWKIFASTSQLKVDNFYKID